MADDLDPEQLRALAAAVAEGTFEAAARALHVTPSAISQRIKALETRVGRVLVRRVKPIVATESGEILLRAARQLDAIVTDALAELADPDPDAHQTVALAVNADSLATWLLPVLAQTADGAEGRISFDVRRADESQTAALLREGAVMAAVTAAADAVPGCTVAPLGAMRYRPCAAPDFIRRWLPEGGTPAELASAPVVRFDRDDTLQDAYLRRRVGAAADPPGHHIPGSGAFAQAVTRGLGWGMVPDLQSAPLLASGQLSVFDPAGVADVELYWQQWRIASRTLDLLSRSVMSAARVALVVSSPAPRSRGAGRL